MIKAAVCREFGAPLTIESVRLAAPGPGEVSVRIKACAICHSDIIAMDGGWGGTLPAVFGHEAAGVVEALGENVRGLTVGDPVVVTLIRSCGNCFYCSRGVPTQCEGASALDAASPISDESGAALRHGLRTAGFAEAVTVDASQVCPIAEDVPFDAASLLSCGVITGLGAVVNTAKMPPGSDAVVIGCGGVGLNSVQGAALSGGRRIIAVDLSDDKLAAAKRFGATHGVNPGKEDVVQAVKDLTDGHGADFVFVTVGATKALEQAPLLLNKGGAAVLVGMQKSGETMTLDALTLTDGAQKLLGSKMGGARLPVDIPWLVDRYRDGRLKLDELISGRYPLDRINEAIDEVRSGAALRNVIIFD